MLGKATIAAIALAAASMAQAQQSPARPDTYGGGSTDKELRNNVEMREKVSSAVARAYASESGALVSPERWFEEHFVRDLDSLEKLSIELVELFDASGSPDRRAVSKRAGRIAKHSRDAWSNVQHRRSTRPKLPTEADGAARASAREDARALRRLVAEVRFAIAAEQKSRQIDAKRRLEIVEKLEQVNVLALRIQRDAGP